MAATNINKTMTLLSSCSRRSLIIAFDVLVVKKQFSSNSRRRLMMMNQNQNHHYHYHPSIIATSNNISSSSVSSVSTINGPMTKQQQQQQQQSQSQPKQLPSSIGKLPSFASTSLLLLSSSSFHIIRTTTTTTTTTTNNIILQRQQRRRNFSSYSSSSSAKKLLNLKVAIVGSGPSGCYTAKYLQSSFANLNNKKQQQQQQQQQEQQEKTTKLNIDILDRLPTPYGLVRNGVAPDHPEVKNVQNDFDTLFTSSTNSTNDGSTSSNSNIQFYGNVNVGGNSSNECSGGISLEELRQLYDIVVLAYGCESDRNLPIQMDINSSTNTNTNVLSARQFVNWYNGHIDYNYIGTIVERCLSSSKNKTNKKTNQNQNQNIVVIGHGNVALDCARILAKSYDELNPTDITTQSLNIIQQQRPNNRKKRVINVLGRRGHIQAAFTIKEIRELTKLEPNAKFVVLKEELDAGKSTESSKQELKDSRPRTRIDQLLTKHCHDHEKEKSTDDNNEDEEDEDDSSNNNTVVNLRFLMNPIRLESDHDDNDNSNSKTVTRVVCERTQLVGDVGKQTAQGTGIEEIFDADLVLVSIGYKGLAIPGTEQWYDESKGIIQNTNGFVDDGRGGSSDNNNKKLAPLYVSGWLKRGPSGIIGTNIADAKDTVSSILKDYLASINSDSGSKDEKDSSASSLLSLKEILQERNVQIVDWKGYQRIDDVERNDMKRKRHPDQPREKIITKSELLEVASRKYE